MVQYLAYIKEIEDFCTSEGRNGRQDGGALTIPVLCFVDWPGAYVHQYGEPSLTIRALTLSCYTGSLPNSFEVAWVITKEAEARSLLQFTCSSEFAIQLRGDRKQRRSPGAGGGGGGGGGGGVPFNYWMNCRLIGDYGNI